MPREECPIQVTFEPTSLAVQESKLQIKPNHIREKFTVSFAWFWTWIVCDRLPQIFIMFVGIYILNILNIHIALLSYMYV